MQLGLNLLIVGAAVFASWRRFCRQDRERLTDRLASLVVHLPPSWLAGSLWLVVRRQWISLLAVGLALVAFAACTEYARSGGDQAVALAPVLLFAVGCVLGFSAFALEQAGVQRFLGDQRFPRNRIWLAKVGVWLAALAVAIGCVAAVCWGRINVYDTPPFDTATSLGRAIVFGMLGFSTGQFFGIHDRRLPVVLCLTLLVAAPIGAAWYAPLFGGAPVWQLGVVSLVFLAATRLELRRWSAGRLDGAGHWIRCGLVAFVAFAWTGLLLWQRTVVVPDVGAPFVVTESPTETLAEQDRSKRLALPDLDAGYRSDLWRKRIDAKDATVELVFGRWHESGIEIGPNALKELPEPLYQFLSLGAPDEDRDEFAQKIAKAFAGDWSTVIRKELAVETRRVPALGDAESEKAVDSLKYAAQMSCLKSLLLVAEGKSEAAVDDLALAMAIVRHLYLFGGRPHETGIYAGLEIDYVAFETANTMLRRGGSDPALCRRLLDVLNRHARELPSFADHIKAWYAMSDRNSPRRIEIRDKFAGLAGPLLESPLESERDDRLQKALCRGLLAAADQQTLLSSPLPRYGPNDWNLKWSVPYLAVATPDRSADDWARIVSQQSMSEQIPFFYLFRQQVDFLSRDTARLTALRLACAAALFRHDHHRDLESLAELSPEYFPTAPTSPFSECPFVLRRSPGETWNLGTDESSIRRTIAPGTQVIEIPDLPLLKIAVPSIQAELASVRARFSSRGRKSASYGSRLAGDVSASFEAGGFVMLRAIVWKEWRQQRIFMFVILAVVPGLLAILGWLSGLFASARSGTSINDKLAFLFLWVPFLQAIVTGSMLFAGESETGTLDFLDACSADRSRIWFAKMASALAIMLPAVLLPAILFGPFALPMACLALEVLVLAAAASVFFRTTLRAMGATVLLLLLTFAIEWALVAAIHGILPGGWAAVVAFFGLHLANVAAAVFVSWRRFCRQDRGRLTDGLGSVLVGVVPPGWLTGSLWMLFRRQWMTLLVVGLAYLAFYVWIDRTVDRYNQWDASAALAPAFLLAIGCVFGWNVFALEQAGAERFLGDQRFPRNRLWLAKVGVWLALTIVAILLAHSPIASAYAMQTTYSLPPGTTWLETSGISALLPGVVFGMLGFSAAQFFGIHDRRLPVSIALTLLAVVPIGAAWYAPISGGAPVWHLAAIPIFLLAAGRFELRRWTAGRLEGAAAWIRCGLVVLVCFAWTGLLLWQRTTEVPDVGEPFVTQGSSIESPLEQERNERLASLAADGRFDRLTRESRSDIHRRSTSQWAMA